MGICQFKKHSHLHYKYDNLKIYTQFEILYSICGKKGV